MFSKATLILEALNEFWESNDSESWTKNMGIQTLFAKKLIEKNIINSQLSSDTKLAKFARQKTSHFEQLGLINSERRITELGDLLLSPGKYVYYQAITNGNAAFLISLLNYKIGNCYLIREFLEEISKKGSMSIEFFKNNYINGNPTNKEEIILEIRNSLPLNNYENFNKLIPHQKGDKFNKEYFSIFRSLLEEENPKYAFKLINQKNTIFWKKLKKLIFGTTKWRDVENFIFQMNDENLALAFLEAKLNASLDEYWDMWSLNLESTGIFSVTADLIYVSKDFAEISNELDLQFSIDISNIPELFTDPELYNNFEINNITLNDFVIENREKEFDKFLQENMTVDLLIEFLKKMSVKDYSDINKFFEGSANDPTYAEFLVTLAFHFISGKKMKFIEAWNGSLSANNRPLHYATGSKPDSQFYVGNNTYLIETTIQTGQQQTTNEIAPISKHLHDNTKNQNKIAILFARDIFSETERQMKFQRNGESYIFGKNFIWLANQLEDLVSLEDFREEVMNV